MIEPQNVLSHELKEAGNRIADDGGAEVSYVQFFRDVGTGKFDDDFLPHRRAGSAKQGILEHFLELLREKTRREGEIDKAGTGNVDGRKRGGKFAVQRVDDFLGDCSRILLEAFRQAKRAVALVVAKSLLRAGRKIRFRLFRSKSAAKGAGNCATCLAL